MKNIIQILLIGLLLNSCKTTSQTNTAYHPIVQKAKETSLFAEQIDWEKLNEKFIQLTRDSSGFNDGLQFLINSLEDKHASFRSANDQSIIVSYRGKTVGNDPRNSSFVNEVINDLTAKFEYRELEDNVGYLKIVAIAPGRIKENADLIRSGLIALKEKGVNKWIVDLRYNGGGDMNPMLSGLAPLIGEGFIGGSVDNHRDLLHNFKITKGQFYDNNRLVAEMKNDPTIDLEEKVVILLSRYTISSGELTAIAFKGRPNTHFIGEKTAGYTTGNGWVQIGDDLIMCISESVFMDRDSMVYYDKVEVDKAIAFKGQINIEGDDQILEAMEWLKID